LDDRRLTDHSSLELRLGVHFNDPSLLRQALTHRSAVNEGLDVALGDNERLEFLGDAILGAIGAEELYRVFPHASEGSLTNLRAELVRQSGLAHWARSLCLAEEMILGRGEDQRGGRERDGLLASGFEAVVGALYLDQGYEPARALIAALVRERVPSLSPSSRAQDPKSELQYRAQTLFGMLPSYEVVSVEGPEHRPVFTVEVRVGEDVAGRGIGPSKQAAEQDAAQGALRMMGDL
jgi:ribonuclease-3